ncbi:MAG TPA: TlpA disulfide reductase family protein [Pirellulales bacterium]|jgi:thiol-disulfide isomerase/thioredoxin|nr:TlpA disulfide reductase family protein [Pirellulales bacterium]
MSLEIDRDSSSNPSPVHRYHGVRGALATGLVAFGLTTLPGGVGAVLIGLLLGQLAPARFLFTRFAAFGAIIGVAVVLCRLISRGETDRLVTFRSVRGEKSLGWAMIASIFLTGYLGQRMPPPTADKNSVAPSLGTVVELAGPTLSGPRFDLKDRRGHVVLVDYWATWCGPCLAELPNVRSTYEKFHDQGFEVVAVNMDDDRDALEKFLAEHPEPWPQIFFDTEEQRGFNNPLATQFGIHAIPVLMVIDRQGKLTAYGVRGGQIETAVAEALGVPVPWSRRLLNLGIDAMECFMYAMMGAPWWLLFSVVVSTTVGAVLIESSVRRRQSWHGASR